MRLYSTVERINGPVHIVEFYVVCVEEMRKQVITF